MFNLGGANGITLDAQGLRLGGANGINLSTSSSNGGGSAQPAPAFGPLRQPSSNTATQHQPPAPSSNGNQFYSSIQGDGNSVVQAVVNGVPYFSSGNGQIQTGYPPSGGGGHSNYPPNSGGGHNGGGGWNSGWPPTPPAHPPNNFEYAPKGEYDVILDEILATTYINQDNITANSDKLDVLEAKLDALSTRFDEVHPPADDGNDDDAASNSFADPLVIDLGTSEANNNSDTLMLMVLALMLLSDESLFPEAKESQPEAIPIDNTAGTEPADGVVPEDTVDEDLDVDADGNAIDPDDETADEETPLAA